MNIGPFLVRLGQSVPLKVLLVRHGQSQTNVDPRLHSTIPDPDVELTNEGREQAARAGAFLRDWLSRNHRGPFRLYRSDYKRAIQTSDIIAQLISVDAGMSIREDDRIRELEFGYSDTIPDANSEETLRHYNAYKDLWDGEAKFYRRRLGGESPADVGDRLRHFIGAMYRDQEKYGINTFVVVNHGLTSRVLAKLLLKGDRAWYAKQKNPQNCAIRLIVGKNDHGYIHGREEEK